MNSLQLLGHAFILIGLVALCEAGVQRYRERTRKLRIIRRVMEG